MDKYKVGDKFKVDDDYNATYKHQALVGDTLVLVKLRPNGDGEFDNLVSRGTNKFYWSWGRLKKIKDEYIPNQNVVTSGTLNLGGTIGGWSMSATEMPYIERDAWTDAFRSFYYLDEPIINKPKKTFMTNIQEFAKNLALNEDERALRKTGLQDDNGNWTTTAKEMVSEMTAKEFGFKSHEEIKEKFATTNAYSPLEYKVMFDKYEANLVAIAKEMIAEEKKTCRK